jgi:HAD superfamily hydrolase (TIGR01509 family)
MIDSGLETIDGAVDMVKRLHASYPLGVVTSADRRELDKKFGRFDLQKYFSVIVTSSDVENRKPHPEPYARGVERLQKYVQVSPVEVFVVEDNPSGVLSAKAAGCTVIACPNGPTKGMRFPGADAIVKGLAEIDGDFLRALWLRT